MHPAQDGVHAASSWCPLKISGLQSVESSVQTVLDNTCITSHIRIFETAPHNSNKKIIDNVIKNSDSFFPLLTLAINCFFQTGNKMTVAVLGQSSSTKNVSKRVRI